MNIKGLKKALPLILENTKLTPLIIGHTGMGKTETVREYCNEQDMQFVDLRLGTQEIGDILGLQDFELDANGTRISSKFMRPEWFPTSGKGIIFLDEINRARKDVLQAVFQLILDKRIHTHVLPEGWHIVAACNPDTEDYVVNDLKDSAFVNRFVYLKFTPSAKEWCKFATSKGTSDDLVSFIEEQPEMLDGKNADFQLDFIKPSRRSLFELDKVYRACENKELFKEIAFGTVGVPTTIAFIKHCEKENEVIVDGLELLNNFDANKKKLDVVIEKKRTDILNRAIDKIIENLKVLVDNKPAQENLRKTILTVPRELSFKVMDALESLDNEEVQNHFFNDLELVDYALPDTQAEKESA